MSMSWFIYDPDEWEPVIESHDLGTDPFGNRMASVSYTQRKRSSEEVAKIKAEKRRLHEDAVLAEALAIRTRRINGLGD